MTLKSTTEAGIARLSAAPINHVKYSSRFE